MGETRSDLRQHVGERRATLWTTPTFLRPALVTSVVRGWGGGRLRGERGRLRAGGGWAPKADGVGGFRGVCCLLEEVAVGLCDERDGAAVGARARRPSDAMDIGGHRCRQLIIDHRLDVKRGGGSGASGWG